MAFHIEALVVTYKCVIMEHITVSVVMILLLLLMIQLDKWFLLNWDIEMVSVLYIIINNVSVVIYPMYIENGKSYYYPCIYILLYKHYDQ